MIKTVKGKYNFVSINTDKHFAVNVRAEERYISDRKDYEISHYCVGIECQDFGKFQTKDEALPLFNVLVEFFRNDSNDIDIKEFEK